MDIHFRQTNETAAQFGPFYSTLILRKMTETQWQGWLSQSEL
jgi:hypothetical protein